MTERDRSGGKLFRVDQWAAATAEQRCHVKNDFVNEFGRKRLRQHHPTTLNKYGDDTSRAELATKDKPLSDD